MFRLSKATIATALSLLAILPLRPAHAAPAPIELFTAPASTRSDATTLIWNRPDHASPGQTFEIRQDDQVVATTQKTYFTASGLKPANAYRFQVFTAENGSAGAASNQVKVSTSEVGARISVLDFGAVGDGRTKATKAIQAAIDACPANGTVVMPRGEFLSGAIFLKSNMTLLFEEGAVLRGSTSASDYAPMIRNRFEGWELDTYASLINAGRLDRAGPSNVQNLSIRGRGKIVGGGNPLAKEMIAAAGLRGRGRLILLMNCENVQVEGVTLEEPPAWTLHYVYSKNITIQGLTIRTKGIRNGDGIDPDSSVNSHIFACIFDTGDDCIAIKSGKNPEGNIVARPTENVRIMDCTFIDGHGISIGSEMSGGVRKVLVEDCVADNLMHGFQIKATKDRGGFVEDVTVQNCELRKLTIYTELPYNNDGEPAASLPVFRNFKFRNIDLTKAAPGPVVVVNGYADPAHYTQNVVFERIKLPKGAVIQVDQSRDVVFKEIAAPAGDTPKFEITRSERVVH